MATDFKEDFNLFDPDFLLLNSPSDDATMDIALHADISPNEFPNTAVRRGPPDRANFKGALNFAVEVNSSDVNKNKFLYSHRLNRIYVNMETNFPIQFNWDWRAQPQMYVRATVVFSDESQAEKRVERCMQHVHQSSSTGLPQEIVSNVLHSSRELGTQGVYYCGAAALPDSWYSVLVQLTKNSSEATTHAYKFVCKNSCTSGINRRAIAVIFTLEDCFGGVHGRRTVAARACACPLRDLRKDEAAEGVYKSGRKRVPANQLAPAPPAPAAHPAHPAPACKKIKMETVAGHDDKIVTLPPWQVVGKKSVIIGLEVMLNMMEQAQTRNSDKDNKYINDFRRQLEEFKKLPS